MGNFTGSIDPLIPALASLLTDCSDQLAREIESRYAGTLIHPVMHYRFEQEMACVRQARELLAAMSIDFDGPVAASTIGALMSAVQIG